MTGVISNQRSSTTQLRSFDRMPPELLSMIMKRTWFPIHSVGPANEGTIHACLANMENAIACSQVCSCWRRVSLSLPSLWTDISSTHAMAQMFSMRSAPLILDLFVLARDNDVTRFLERLPHIVDRIGSLLMISRGEENIRGILSAFDSSAAYPKLMRLSIEHDQWLEGDDPVLPAVTMCMPNLHILHLKQISIDITLLANLTELSLKMTFFEFDPFKCSADQLLALIRRSPRLETLILDQILLEPPLNSSSSVVELPQLQCLCLKDLIGDFSPARWLLERIHVPSWTYIEAIPGVNSDTFRAADLAWKMMVLHIDMHPAHDLHFGLEKDMMISLRDGFRGSWITIPALVTTFDITQMPSLTIMVDGQRSLDSLGDMPAEVGIWNEFMARTPSLKVLHIVAPRVWVVNILSALCPEEARVTGLPCPKLQRLHIQIQADELISDIDMLGTYAYCHFIDAEKFSCHVVDLIE